MQYLGWRLRKVINLAKQRIVAKYQLNGTSLNLKKGRSKGKRVTVRTAKNIQAVQEVL